MEILNKDKVYRHESHLTSSCQYHVIFCTKYRRKVLEPAIQERIKIIFEEVAEKYNFVIVEMEIMPDHIHLLLDCNPRFGVMDCVRKLKGTSSRLLREEFASIKSRLPTLWTRSAFISSVGAVSLETVKEYISNQKHV